MTKKIFHSILLVACTVLLACYLVILTSLNDYFTSLRKSQLKTQLSFASTAVEDEGIEYLKIWKTVNTVLLSLIRTAPSFTIPMQMPLPWKTTATEGKFRRLSSPATESPTAIPAP